MKDKTVCIMDSDQHLTWTEWKWTHSAFMCALLIVSMLISSASAVGAEIQYPHDVRDLVSKDGNTLLNPEFLPFLNDCNSANPPNRMLCATYYDMVYNVYEYGGNVADVKAEIRTANEALQKLGDTFCSFFPDEVNQALDKRPVLDVNHINLTAILRINNYCTINCLTVQDTSMQVLIKPICKSISGGCKWILKQKRNSEGSKLDSAVDAKPNENASTKLDETPPVSALDKPKGFNENVKSQNINNNQDAAATNPKGDTKSTTSDDTKTNGIVEQLSKLSPTSNNSTNENPVANPIDPKKDEKNVSKPIDPVLPPQPIPIDAKTGIDLTAPKSIENRPSTPSGSNPSPVKDVNTEQQREDLTNDINQNGDNTGDDNLYKNDSDDQDKQEEDTETGQCQIKLRLDTIPCQLNEMVDLFILVLLHF